MKASLVHCWAAVLLGLAVTTGLQAQTTAFTYQGILTEQGMPATGFYDLSFALFDAETNGVSLGAVTASATTVSQGLFTVTLDFGAAVFDGTELWLQVGVQTNGGDGFTDLWPRSELMPAPFALHSSDSAMLGGQLASGYAPASGSAAYVAKSGDTMTGTLHLPGDGLTVGGSQLVLSAGHVGIGTTSPSEDLTIHPSSGAVFLNLKSEDSFAQMLIDRAMEGHNGSLLFRTGGSTDWMVGELGYATTNRDFSIARNPFGRDGTFYIEKSTGNIGVGTSDPTSALEVGCSGWDGIRLTGDGSDDAYIRISNGGDSSWIYDDADQDHKLTVESGDDLGFNTNGPYERMRITTGGRVGIGTSAPGAKLHIAGSAYPDSFAFFDTYTAGQDAGLRFYEGGIHIGGLYNDASAGAIKLTYSGAGHWNQIVLKSDGNVGIGTSTPEETLDVRGTAQVEVLNITGGSDLAEPFDIAGAVRVEPGLLMVIASDRPGKLKVSDRAYDRKVAGVVSGAGGIRPGMHMTQDDLSGEDSVPVALTGRAYAWADAGNGAIEPGDLLTTSSRPGHAMKVTDHERASGAVIGKAMTGLADGTGLVLVLVNLQ